MRTQLLIALVSLGLAGTAWADDGKKPTDAKSEKAAKSDKKVEKLTGEVVDLNCFVGAGPAKATGEKHASCAQKCISEGAPVGLLSGGKVYVVINTDHLINIPQKLGPMAGKTVTLVGQKQKIAGGGHAFDMADVEATTAAK